MSRLSSFILGVIVGAIGLFVSENYYIVRSADNVHLIPKVAAKLEIPYRDIREYTTDDWRNNPSLALAIVKSQKQDLLISPGLDSMRNQFESLLRQIGSQ